MTTLPIWMQSLHPSGSSTLQRRGVLSLCRWTSTFSSSIREKCKALNLSAPQTRISKILVSVSLYCPLSRGHSFWASIVCTFGDFFFYFCWSIYISQLFIMFYCGTSEKFDYTVLTLWKSCMYHYYHMTTLLINFYSLTRFLFLIESDIQTIYLDITESALFQADLFKSILFK